jgi:hypothetical protein
VCVEGLEGSQRDEENSPKVSVPVMMLRGERKAMRAFIGYYNAVGKRAG